MSETLGPYTPWGGGEEPPRDDEATQGALPDGDVEFDGGAEEPPATEDDAYPDVDAEDDEVAETAGELEEEPAESALPRAEEEPAEQPHVEELLSDEELRAEEEPAEELHGEELTAEEPRAEEEPAEELHSDEESHAEEEPHAEEPRVEVVPQQMPEPPHTGEQRVDEAVAPLQDLGALSTEEHVDTYELAHSSLQDVLADLDNDDENDGDAA